MSTAVMYAFDQRADTRCIDEPLYGYYLSHYEASHPGRDDVIAKTNCDGPAVVADTILGPSDRPVLFMKQMAHHIRGLDWTFLKDTINVLLTRDPVEVLPTLVKQIPNATLTDAGYDTQLRLLDYLQSIGQPLLVLDAKELLLDPRSVLEQLCAGVDLAFDPAMLSWPAGPRECDGVWAPHWYQAVHQSTGFAPYRPKTEPFPESLQPLLQQCVPFYEQIYALAMRAPASAHGTAKKEKLS